MNPAPEKPHGPAPRSWPGRKQSPVCYAFACEHREPYLTINSCPRQTGLLAAFGGGLISAFLLQDPQKFGISLFTDNSVGVTWTLCWWLINYCPADLVNTIHNFLPVRVVTKARWLA